MLSGPKSQLFLIIRAILGNIGSFCYFLFEVSEECLVGLGGGSIFRFFLTKCSSFKGPNQIVPARAARSVRPISARASPRVTWLIALSDFIGSIPRGSGRHFSRKIQFEKKLDQEQNTHFDRGLTVESRRDQMAAPTSFQGNATDVYSKMKEIINRLSLDQV